MKTNRLLGLVLLLGVSGAAILLAGSAVTARGLNGHPPPPPPATPQSLMEGLLSILGVSSSASPQVVTATATAQILGDIPAPGAQVTYQFTITPMSTDGEHVDSYRVYAPTGWTVLSISGAPPVNSGCSISTTSVITDVSGRELAYWGVPGADFTTDPPTLPPRTGCGPYTAGTQLQFAVTFQVSPDGERCPGSPWVGVPLDSQAFTPEPVRVDSMPSYLRGDGSGDPPHTEKISWRSPCPQVDVSFDKSFGTELNECFLGAPDPRDVLPGGQVPYCFLMINNSPLVTLSQQTIHDPAVGVAIEGWPLTIPGQNGGFTYTLSTIDAEPGACLENTAVWTTTTATGFGQFPQDDLSAPFTFTQYTASRQASATVCVVTPTLSIHLPLLFENHPAP